MESLVVLFPVSGVETVVFVPPLVAFVVAFFASTAGVSGAFLLLPFQMSVLGYTAPSVSATNLLYNVVGTPGGIYRYRREGRLDWTLALRICAGLIPGILLGYYLRLAYLPDPKPFKLFVGTVLLVIGLRLLLEAAGGVFRRPTADPPPDDSVPPGAQGLSPPGRLSYSVAAMLSLSVLVGVVGGAYGVGGGAILAPFCIAVFRLPVHRIAGAVLFATFASSLAGVAFYSLVPVNGQMSPPDWWLGGLLGLGGLAGTYLGARTQRRVPERWIKALLGGMVTLVALRYVFQYLLD
jgi:uncharacterized membrane protein YfcA